MRIAGNAKQPRSASATLAQRRPGAKPSGHANRERHHDFAPMETQHRLLPFYHWKVERQGLHMRSPCGTRVDAERVAILTGIGCVVHVGSTAEAHGPGLCARNRPETVLARPKRPPIDLDVTCEGDGRSLVRPRIPYLIV